MGVNRNERILNRMKIAAHAPSMCNYRDEALSRQVMNFTCASKSETARLATYVEVSDKPDFSKMSPGKKYEPPMVKALYRVVRNKAKKNPSLDDKPFKFEKVAERIDRFSDNAQETVTNEGGKLMWNLLKNINPHLTDSVDKDV